MIRTVASAILVLFWTHASAVEFTKLIPDRSRIDFTSKQMGVPIDGRFNKFSGDIYFDPARPDLGRAQIDIDLNSIDVGSAEANEEVKSKGWFNTREFPIAKFSAESLRALANNRFEARGKLSIKGRVRDVVLPFEYKIEGGNALLEGKIPLVRSQFGLGEGPWADTSVVADEVPVRFRLVLSPSPVVKPATK